MPYIAYYVGRVGWELGNPVCTLMQLTWFYLQILYVLPGIQKIQLISIKYNYIGKSLK